MSDYWGKRIADSQNKLTGKNIKQTEKQLRRYYARTMESVISSLNLHMRNFKTQLRRAAHQPPPIYTILISIGCYKAN